MLDWAPLEGPGRPVKFGWAVLAGAGWLVTFGWAVLPGPGLLVKLGGAVFPVPDNIGWDADFCGGIPEVRTWTWVDDWVDLRDIWELDEFELKSEKKREKIWHRGWFFSMICMYIKQQQQQKNNWSKA